MRNEINDYFYSAVLDYDIPKTVPACRDKLREEFEKHKHIQDIRVIDMLVIKVKFKYDNHNRYVFLVKLRDITCMD